MMQQMWCVQMCASEELDRVAISAQNTHSCRHSKFNLNLQLRANWGARARAREIKKENWQESMSAQIKSSLRLSFANEMLIRIGHALCNTHPHNAFD